MYVYIKTEKNLWTVGFYSPEGRWYPESDYSSAEKAAERVHYLNGGIIESKHTSCPRCGGEQVDEGDVICTACGYKYACLTELEKENGV